MKEGVTIGPAGSTQPENSKQSKPKSQKQKDNDGIRLEEKFDLETKVADFLPGTFIETGLSKFTFFYLVLTNMWASNSNFFQSPFSHIDFSHLCPVHVIESLGASALRVLTKALVNLSKCVFVQSYITSGISFREASALETALAETSSTGSSEHDLSAAASERRLLAVNLSLSEQQTLIRETVSWPTLNAAFDTLGGVSAALVELVKFYVVRVRDAEGYIDRQFKPYRKGLRCNTDFDPSNTLENLMMLRHGGAGGSHGHGGNDIGAESSMQGTLASELQVPELLEGTSQVNEWVGSSMRSVAVSLNSMTVTSPDKAVFFRICFYFAGSSESNVQVNFNDISHFYESEPTRLGVKVVSSSCSFPK